MVARGIVPPSYRLPEGTRVGRVRLQVADLGRSLAYYGRVLGLEVRDTGDGEASLGAAGARSPLIELRERPAARPMPPGGRPGLYHYAILVPDRASLGRFLRHLGDLGERAGASDHLVSEAVYLRDPDGLGIEVYADRARSEWRYEAGQLAMATRPLDVGSVVREAGGEVWSGMPADTVIGHVHLHVGDLEEASAFYHEGLGLDKVVWSYPGALFLSAGGYHHHLGVNTWAATAAPAGDGDAQLLEWELVVPSAEDVRAVGRSLESGGHDTAESGADVVARDPWGTPLRIRASGSRA